MRTEGYDIAGTGFTVLDRVYADGRTPSEALGGSCGNVLVSLAMLRRSVVPLLKLGCDAVGNRLVAEFAEAGADTHLIFRKRSVASPVLAQVLETSSGRHSFSFVCPETQRDYPRYMPIDQDEVRRAEQTLRSCTVFYTDRLSPAIVDAIETARSSGALVYLEPSEIGDVDLFKRALPNVTVLKYSADRLGPELEGLTVDAETIQIVTYGDAGLQVVQGDHSYWCDALPAKEVKDTCGSGDMVSVGVIDHMLQWRRRCETWGLSGDALRQGVLAGQRLATANCAFVGARGLFSQRGPETARAVLNGDVYMNRRSTWSEAM